jgi:hypothetical protein
MRTGGENGGAGAYVEATPISGGAVTRRMTCSLVVALVVMFLLGTAPPTPLARRAGATRAAKCHTIGTSSASAST